MAVEATAYARAGLVGNPSDGYYGKTISFVVRNFAAKVSLYENPELEIVPSFQDRFNYASIEDLANDVKNQGYYGGIRLMKATICRFARYCRDQGITLPRRNFSIRYRSTIPRRVGLAGSSALVTATLRCLLEFYEVDIPKPEQANLILSVETMELGISAGLQDRVIQVYEGCVFMDFDRAYMEEHGHGQYAPIEPRLLPKLYIAYRTDLAEGSETVHNDIRERWNQGDQQVVKAMEDFAACAQEAYDLLLADRGAEIGPILDRNFDLRRKMYQIASGNLELVERARAAGASAKFSGSGGAIVGTYKDEAMLERLVEAFEDTDTSVLVPEIE